MLASSPGCFGSNWKPKSMGEYMDGAIRVLGGFLTRDIKMCHKGQLVNAAIHSVMEGTPDETFMKQVVHIPGMPPDSALPRPAYNEGKSCCL